jgi:hypothetical protein
MIGSSEHGNPSYPEQAEKTLRLPLKLALTEVAVQYFLLRNKRLGKIRLAENTEEHGLEVKAISIRNLQTMLKLGYISLIETAHSDLLSYRSEVFDLTKLLVQALLFLRFDREIMDYALKKESFVHLRRANPSLRSDSPADIKKLLTTLESKKQEQDHQMIRNFLVTTIFKQISLSRDISKEDKEERKQLCLSYLDNLGYPAWTLIALAYTEKKDRIVLLDFAGMLRNFIRKSSVAEYLSLMLIELISYIENLNMLQFINTHYDKRLTFEQLLRSPDLRQRLVAEMEKDEERTYLTWDISYNPQSTVSRHKLTVSIFNREFGYGRVFDEINRKANVNVVEQSLHDFIRGSASPLVDAELGLNYLSYLKDACTDLGIYFVSSVHRLPKSDLAMVNCHLHF